jgi:gluconate 2-dehydrogenase gamma chain
MNRREALRLLATGTALQLAPRHLLAAMREARAAVGAQNSLRILTPHQCVTVRALAEMIIPRTETPGAADTGACEFVDLMLAEWYDLEDRERFLQGLSDLDAHMIAIFGQNFVESTADRQAQMMTELGEKMVEEIERRKTEPAHDVDVPEAESFYPMLRRLTLTAYYTSEAGATEELHFQIIPDRHDMCAAENHDKGGD